MTTYDPEEITITVGGQRINCTNIECNNGIDFGVRSLGTIRENSEGNQRLINWIDEFYDFPEDCIDTAADALRQGIKKWTGCQPGILAVRDMTIYAVFGYMKSDSCALCEKYHDPILKCIQCPLGRSGNECNRPGSLWQKAVSGDPFPLIDKLKELLVRELGY